MSVLELETLSKVGFSTVVGNPPYQTNIAKPMGEEKLRNASKALPIYDSYVYLASALRPLQAALIMPAKWYAGGWGLDSFRAAMLSSTALSTLVDFRGSEDVFVGTDVNGGICVAHWLRGEVESEVHVVRHAIGGEVLEDSSRNLTLPGGDFLIRDHHAVSILEKVKSFELKPEESFTSLIRGGFGMNTNFSNYEESPEGLTDPIVLYRIGEEEVWMERSGVSRQHALIDGWKIFMPLCHSERGKTIVGRSKIFGPGSACTHSYLPIEAESEEGAKSILSYMKTKTFRFLASQLKISPIGTRQVYRLIPILPWDREWTDDDLYRLWGLSEEEIKHIESSVAPISW